MPWYLLHAGTTLQKSSVNGVLTDITLPAGVTMVDTRPARVAILAKNIVVVNAVSRNIVVEPVTLTSRLLSIDEPLTAADGAVGGAGVMVGAYRFAYTYAIVAGDEILTESPLSPITGPINTNNHSVTLTNVTISPTAGVTTRIIYSTVADGTDFYEVDRIEDNVTTTINLNSSDYDLALLPISEDKGNPPGVDGTDRFRIIVTWKDRLFASPNNEPDFLYISGNREIYSWSETRRITVPSQGEDETGIVAFMARRDELVIAKRRKLWKLIGNDPSDFELVLIADGIGAVSPEACVVIRDTCYFLGEDGFYEYGPNGVVKLSREKVQPWFTTDTYFNRAYFATSFCKFNQLYDKVELHLAAAGSTTIDRWVEFDLRTNAWYGIHKTDAFSPTCAGAMDDANGFLTPVIGASNAFMYRQNQPTASDAGTAIDMDVTTKFHSGGMPDLLHYWGDLSILSKVEAGGTLIVTPTVGDLDALPQAPLDADLTLDRNSLARLGYGRLCQLRFQNSEANQPVTIFGYEIPYFAVGKR